MYTYIEIASSKKLWNEYDVNGSYPFELTTFPQRMRLLIDGLGEQE